MWCACVCDVSMCVHVTFLCVCMFMIVFANNGQWWLHSGIENEYLAFAVKCTELFLDTFLAADL